MENARQEKIKERLEAIAEISDDMHGAAFEVVDEVLDYMPISDLMAYKESIENEMEEVNDLLVDYCKLSGGNVPPNYSKAVIYSNLVLFKLRQKIQVRKLSEADGDNFQG